MIMLGKKKKPAALIVSAMMGGKPSGAEGEGDEGDDPDMPYTAAGHDLIKAIESKDAARVGQIIKNICVMADDDSDYEEKAGPEPHEMG